MNIDKMAYAAVTRFELADEAVERWLEIMDIREATNSGLSDQEQLGLLSNLLCLLRERREARAMLDQFGLVNNKEI